MQATLLIDSDGPNPDYIPPDPRGATEEEAAINEAAYEEYIATVPHSIIVPAGTLLDGPRCWVHCLPDGSGDSSKRIPGVIRAEPADDQCRRVVEARVKEMKPLQKQMYDLALRKLKIEIEKQKSRPKDQE